jgi:nucleoside-diphosphate-sugar epimerase
MNIALIGYRGFVGSAFARYFEECSISFVGVDRVNYSAHTGRTWDVVLHCAANSKKFVAEETPLVDLEQSLELTSRILRDFPSKRHLLISTVDVYNNLAVPESTRETTPVDLSTLGNYGFHKRLSELLVLRHSPHPLIFRLAGMVGPGLKKNPVFDVTRCQPLRIHPDSGYQFLHTSTVANILWNLQHRLEPGEILNVCGRGMVSPREIAQLAGVKIDLSQVSGPPRIVDICVEKLSRLVEVPETTESIRQFLGTFTPTHGHHTHTPES